MNHNKGVTLIELMVVVIVLGILAVIAVPNIKNIKGKAQISAALENKNTVQKGTDRYFLEKQELPVSTAPTKEIPAQIDWTKLVPPYIRSKPTDLGKIFYWVDYNNTVWVSDIDAPIGVSLGVDNKTVTWSAVEGATGYEVGYIEESATVSNGKIMAGKGYKELQEVTGATTYTSPIDLSGKTIVVSSISDKFKSAPAGAGYGGYIAEASSGTPATVNHKPVAVISMSPESNITTATTVTWGYEGSTDEDGDILTAEWILNGTAVDTVPSTFTNETYTVGLKVKDSKGLESDLITKEFTVAKADPLSQLQLGQYVKYGKYNGYDLTWQVVKISDGNVMLFATEPLKNTNGTYMLKAFDKVPAAGEPIDTYRTTYGSNNWYYSDIRAWLNNDFYNTAFINNAYIKDTTHDYILADIDKTQAASGTEEHNAIDIIDGCLQNYDTAYKKNVSDKVYLINIKELVENIYPILGVGYYNSLYNYCTRDSLAYSSNNVRIVATNSRIGCIPAYSPEWIRPALNLSSAVFKSGSGTQADPYVIE